MLILIYIHIYNTYDIAIAKKPKSSPSAGGAIRLLASFFNAPPSDASDIITSSEFCTVVVLVRPLMILVTAPVVSNADAPTEPLASVLKMILSYLVNLS